MNRMLRPYFALAAILAALAFTVVTADAKPGGSVGSRGSRTFTAPPTTATAPKAARPIERTMTQPGQTTPGAATAARPTAPAAGGFFNRPGILGGLAAGFLGAGLFGMLFGHGLAGGLGGIASFLGLLLQIGIVAIVAMLVWRWWQNRSQPAAAYAGGSQMRESGGDTPPRSFLGGLGLGGMGGQGQGQAPGGQGQDAQLELEPKDFDTFERLLGEVLVAYGAEDLNALRSRVTPEMLSYYNEEMARNTSNGDSNPISDVKLLQGDLAEAWREGDDEYATVAMRYSLNDRLVDRNTGKLIEQLPGEVTENLTFRRARGGNWLLSAVQQTEA